MSEQLKRLFEIKDLLLHGSEKYYEGDEAAATRAALEDLINLLIDATSSHCHIAPVP